MISSVIALLSNGVVSIETTLEQITDRTGFEIGELIDGYKLPVTIEAVGPAEMERKTQWLQTLPGIDHVDVVFVHMANFGLAEISHSSRSTRSAHTTKSNSDS